MRPCDLRPSCNRPCRLRPAARRNGRGRRLNAIVVTTAPITNNIGGGTATCGGTVSGAGTAITERGICWSTSADPVRTGNHATVAGTTGTFSADIIGMLQGDTCHVRAYAVAGSVTFYGQDVEFVLADAMPDPPPNET
jgi:hypothetical protein